METFDVQKSIEAQAAYVQQKDFPHFAPRSGVCFRCKQNIYRQIDHGEFKSGISVEKAGSELVTGCPHCHWSYCE